MWIDEGTGLEPREFSNIAHLCARWRVVDVDTLTPATGYLGMSESE